MALFQCWAVKYVLYCGTLCLCLFFCVLICVSDFGGVVNMKMISETKEAAGDMAISSLAARA